MVKYAAYIIFFIFIKFNEFFTNFSLVQRGFKEGGGICFDR